MLSQNKQLLNAARRGRPDLVKQSIQGGASVNATDENGDTALILATVFGYSDPVKFLIRVKADVNLKGQDGNTALILAAR